MSINQFPGLTEENNKDCRKYNSCACTARNFIPAQYK